MNIKNAKSLAKNVEASLNRAYEEWSIADGVGPEGAAALCFVMGMSAFTIIKGQGLVAVVNHGGVLKPLVGEWPETIEEQLTAVSEIAASLREADCEVVHLYRVSPASFDVAEEDSDVPRPPEIEVLADNLNLQHFGASVTDLITNTLYVGEYELNEGDTNFDRILSIGGAWGSESPTMSGDSIIYDAFIRAFNDPSYIASPASMEKVAVGFNHFVEDHPEAVNPSARGFLWDLSMGVVHALYKDIEEQEENS